MQNRCQDSGPLIPSYLDGELSEDQAAPLRRHLLECHACRELAQDEQALKRWFVAHETPAVPAGFAARVARRAFAGDLGVLPAAALDSSAAGAALESESRTIDFVLQLTAVAAAVLFFLALAIRTQSLPDSPGLNAETTYTEVLESLERLNSAEGADVESPPGEEDSKPANEEAGE